MGAKRGQRTAKQSSERGKAPRTARGERTLAQDPRRGPRRVRRARLFRKLDRRDHAARRSRARHLLYLFRFEGGAVPGAGRATCPPRSATMSRRCSRIAATAWRESAGRSNPSSASRASTATSIESSTRPSSSSRQPIANIMKRPRRESPRASSPAATRRNQRRYSDQELDILAWAMMGANVFLGLRFAVWASADPKLVADAMGKLLRSGLGK